MDGQRAPNLSRNEESSEPMTDPREKIDHAELGRLAEVADWFERGDLVAEGGVLMDASVAAEHAADLRYALSEIAALRGRENELIASHAVAVARIGRERDAAVGHVERLADWIEHEVGAELPYAEGETDARSFLSSLEPKT